MRCLIKSRLVAYEPYVAEARTRDEGKEEFLEVLGHKPREHRIEALGVRQVLKPGGAKRGGRNQRAQPRERRRRTRDGGYNARPVDHGSLRENCRVDGIHRSLVK